MKSKLCQAVPQALLAVVFCLAACPALRADPDATPIKADESSKADEQPSKKPAAEGVNKTKGDAEKKPDQDAPPVKDEKKSKLDEDLLKSLDPESDSADETVDRLERAIKNMREAQKKIDAKETGKNTQEIQTRIVKDLEQLIEAIKNQQDQQQNQQNQKQAKKQKLLKEEERKLQQQQLDPQNSAKQKQGSEQGEQPKKAEQAKDSTEQLERQKTLEAERARRERLSKDVWGHLPPALRDKLFNIYSDKYLPKYEDLVRRYYEALAERNQKRTGSKSDSSP